MADAPPTIPRAAPEPLARLPFPLFVRVFALLTSVAFVGALVRVPRAIGVGLDSERGRRDLAAGRDEAAARHFARVIEAYPQSKETRMDFIQAALHADQFAYAAKMLQWFEGKSVSKDEEARLNLLMADFDLRAKAYEKDHPEVKKR